MSLSFIDWLCTAECNALVVEMSCAAIDCSCYSSTLRSSYQGTVCVGTHVLRIQGSGSVARLLTTNEATPMHMLWLPLLVEVHGTI